MINAKKNVCIDVDSKYYIQTLHNSAAPCFIIIVSVLEPRLHITITTKLGWIFHLHDYI